MPRFMMIIRGGRGTVSALSTLRKLPFHFLSNLMGYDRGDSFPFDRIEINLVQNRKENCHHDHIPFNLKGNGNKVFSVCTETLAI